jgi:transposase
MEKRFRDYNPNQQFLIPPSVSDFVPEGHLAHFLRNLVLNELDLSDIEGEYTESRGAPPFSPRMMVAILLYGFTQSVYSSRKLAKACQERIDFMAVSGLNKPQFRTILDFRKRHEDALGEIFVQVLLLCQEAELVKLGHVALDGTKIKANASIDKNQSYEAITEEEESLRKQVRQWIHQVQTQDNKEDKLFGVDKQGDELPDWVFDKVKRAERLKKAKESLEKRAAKKKEARKEAEAKKEKPRSHAKQTDEVAPTQKYNHTDPESNLMKTRSGFVQGYNGQIAVDQESYVIVSCHVSQVSTDRNELKPALQQIEENLQQLPKELSADSGYHSEENLLFLEKKNVRGYVTPQNSDKPSKQRNWTSEVTKKMVRRLAQGGKRSRYHLRKQTVEPVFGIIKAARGYRQSFVRSFNAVQNEWSLICTAHNILKLYAASSG